MNLFHRAKVRSHTDVARGLLDLEVPTLAEANVLQRVAPMSAVGVVGLPPVGSFVVVFRQSGSLRWMPNTDSFGAAWLTSTRRALVSPSGQVLVGLDDQGGTVHLGSFDATKGVGREGDPVEISETTDVALYTWLKAVGTGSGAGAPPATMTGSIKTGSQHVKAVD